MSIEQVLSAVVDRFGGEQAVLLIGDARGRVLFPRSLLPSEAGEGSLLTIILRYEAEGSKRAVEGMQAIIDELEKSSGH